MEVYFVLDERNDPRPVSDVEAWSRWCERADRRVARTAVTPDIAVLTTFTGVDEPAEGKAPLLFNTVVFGGVLDGEEVKHPTRLDALSGHALLVAFCRLGNSPESGLTDEHIT